MVALLLYPQVSQAAGFTGTEFATWSKGQQDGFMQTSVTMAGVVATQTKPSVAECIDAWYRPDTDLVHGRNDEMRALIVDHPRHHPSGVILALLIKRCGPFS